MAVLISENSTIGIWKSLPYQITLYTSGESFHAQALLKDSIIHFEGKQIKWGIKEKDLLQQTFIDKIKSLSPGEIAIFHYPKENPTEIWVFEARPIVGPQIRQGKEYLIQAENNPLLYEKALANFETALKLQQKVNGNTKELEETIFQIKNKSAVWRCNQYSLLYLPRDEEIEKFRESIELYEERIFESFEELLSIEGNFSPYHHLMSALVHEERGEFLLAIEDYLNLSENNPHALACFEKAYALLEKACSQDQQLLNRRDGVRIAFEKCLRGFNLKSPQEKVPNCFVCFNDSEKEIEKWLEEILVPDLNRAGVKPIFRYKDLSQGQDLDNFQELAKNTDLVIIACTPGLKAKYEERKKAPVGVAMELKVIKGRYRDEDKAHKIFPVFLKGTRKEALPSPYFESIFGTELFPFESGFCEFNYFSKAFDLFSAMRGASRDVSRKVREEFLTEAKQIMRGKVELEEIAVWREGKSQRALALHDSIAHRISAHTQMINLPLPPKDFTGREKELTALHEACKHGHRVALVGLGGMGKTALILKYGEMYKSHYQFIHFIRAGSSQLVVDGLLELADDLHIPISEDPKMRLGWLKKKLNQFEREYLLIFDGIDRIGAFDELEKHLPENGRCLLLTSRMSEQAKIRNFKLIETELFSIDEAARYLLLATNSKEEEDARVLAEKLGCLPLALTHAARYIHSLKGTIQEYSARWDPCRVELFEDKYLPLTKVEETILRTWKISMDSIEIDHNCPLAKKVLGFFAFMGQAPIHRSLIKSWFNNFHSQVKELECDHILQCLCNYSMIGSSTRGAYDVHLLVQSVTRYQMLPKFQEEAFEEALITLTKEMGQFEENEIFKWNQAKILIPHAMALFKMHYLMDKVELRRQFEFQYHLGRLCSAMGNLYEALEVQKSCLRIVDIGYKNDPNPQKRKEESFSTAYTGIGNVYLELGKYIKALKYHQKALEINIQVRGKNHPDVAGSYSNIGLTYSKLGNHKKALELHQKALEIRLQFFGKDHLDVSTSFSNIGIIHSKVGNHMQALEYHQNALEIGRRALGDNYPYTVRDHNNIGIVYQALEEYERALESYQKALQMGRPIFGKNHPNIAGTYNNIGLTYSKLGDITNAIHFLKKGLEIRRQVLDENHPDVAASYTNIGFCYNKLGDSAQALYFLQKGFKLNILDENHPDIAINYCSLGFICSNLGEMDTALEFYQKALKIQRQILGESHPDVLISRHNITAIEKKLCLKIEGLVIEAIAFQKEGRKADARRLYGEAFNLLLKVHNESFPVLSDRFLSLEIVKKIPLFDLM